MSLLEFENQEADQNQDQSADQGGQEQAQSRVIEHNGEKIEIPANFWDGKANEGKGAPNIGALAKAVSDLRRQVSEKPKAPDKYDLVLPDALKDKVKVDESHPLAKPAMEWARKHGLGQEAFTELTGIFYAAEAGSADTDAAWGKEQSTALDQALGDDAARVKADIGKWVGGLLGADMKANPELLEEAKALASSAPGVLLLKALKDRIGERGIPSGRDSDARPVSESEIRTMQASDAYRDSGHPDHKKTVAAVREGWKRLYPDQ